MKEGEHLHREEGQAPSPQQPMRETMLHIARRAILGRAALDSYDEATYDPAEDPEGYIVSLLIALMHWCLAHGIDWQEELQHAQALFEQDLAEVVPQPQPKHKRRTPTVSHTQDTPDLARFMRSEEGKAYLDHIRQSLLGRVIVDVMFRPEAHAVAALVHLDEGEPLVAHPSTLHVKAIRRQFQDVLDRICAEEESESAAEPGPIVPSPLLFDTGPTLITPGAMQALRKNQTTGLEYLIRHVTGDWGHEVPEEDQEANRVALQTGARLLSAYTLPDGTKLWIITDAEIDVQHHRYSTTLLLPDEY